MRRINFLLVAGLIMAFGLTAFANENEKTKTKAPKNTGVLSVKTSPAAYPVLVDGQQVGMSGVGTGAEFYLVPGMHTVEIQGPNGQTWKKDLEIKKGLRNCVCIKVLEKTESKNCPYDIRVDGPDKVTEGDLITFAAFNAVSGGAAALNYVWKVSPESARITSGLGTPSITVDTSGLGGQTIRAELDVTDGVYDASCRQRIAINTAVDKIPDVKKPESSRYAEFESVSFDDDKARLDLYAVELQNNPDAQGYIIMYQGTDRKSKGANNVDRLSRRALDYMVKARGIDPRRIQITKAATTRTRSTYDLWIVPPGAQPPVPND